MSWEEIAVVLRRPGEAAPAALRKRFQRLKERLREVAEREGLVATPTAARTGPRARRS